MFGSFPASVVVHSSLGVATPEHYIAASLLLVAVHPSASLACLVPKQRTLLPHQPQYAPSMSSCSQSTHPSTSLPDSSTDKEKSAKIEARQPAD